MKNVISGLFVLSVSSCDFNKDELTIDIAESIIENCLRNNSEKGTMYLIVGESPNYRKDPLLFDFYKTMSKKGYMTFEIVGTTLDDVPIYRTDITKKANEFILKKSSQSSNDSGFSNYEIKLYDFTLIKITEIHESPSINTAKVTAILKKENFTPFFIKDITSVNNDIITRDLNFRKTNNGWRYCHDEN